MVRIPESDVSQCLDERAFSLAVFKIDQRYKLPLLGRPRPSLCEWGGGHGSGTWDQE